MSTNWNPEPRTSNEPRSSNFELSSNLELQPPGISPSQPEQTEIDRLLDRSPAERAREHRYRCAQALVFGLPVVALQWLGGRLGGHEAQRWVAVMQALLAGWAVYVGATGMLSEGVVCWWRRRRITLDFVAGLVVAGLYAASLPPAVHLLFTNRLWFGGPWFHWSVLILAGWTGARWAWLSPRAG